MQKKTDQKKLRIWTLFMECQKIFVFSPNTGRNRPEKNPYLDSFHAVLEGSIGPVLRFQRDMLAFTAVDKGKILSCSEDSWKYKDGRTLKACIE